MLQKMANNIAFQLHNMMNSPDDASHQTSPPSEDNFDCIPSAKIDSTQKTSLQDEVIPTLGLDDYSFDIFGDKKNSDNSENEAGSSSDSDSESETSDTGSESGSHSKGRSKSKSPVGSGSSSDSESDDSKEGSDEDVDIMTNEDDQETKQKLQASSSPIIWEDSSTVAAENGIAADVQDGGSDLVDIENYTPDNDNMEITFPANSEVNKESEKYMELHESPMSLVQTTKDSIKHRELVNRNMDTQYQKYGEQVGKVKESAQVSKPLTSFSLKDNEKTDTDRYPFAIQGSGRTLQTDLSELELGEFREPLLEVTPVVEKQIEQNNPLKQSEDRSITDPNKGKPDGRRFLDQRKKSIPILNNQESLVKKKIPVNHTDSTKLGKSQQPDMIVKPRNNEVGGSYDFSVGGGDINRKLAPKHAELSHSLKNGRKQKSSLLTDVNGQQKDTSLTESREEGVGLKRREPSSDEISCSYSKYEKAAPELKGPIKDFSQYQEYVQEYQAKYDSYCSLNKTLEGYRNEFHKLGTELESAKGKDMEHYYIILGKLNESYSQCSPRHKRLKQIFIFLHEELKNLKQMIKEYATSFQTNPFPNPKILHNAYKRALK